MARRLRRFEILVTCAILFIALPSICAGATPSGYQSIAQEYQIPPPILYAIALTESGLRLNHNLYRPWPWTLNVAGTPRRYATRKTAHQALTYYLSLGFRSIDIGLMQVNWRYHQQKLGTAWQALEPYHNLRTGARILHNAYQSDLNWNLAIGRYHSPGKTTQQQLRAKKYIKRVMHHVSRLKQTS